jgi:hypothetical protein
MPHSNRKLWYVAAPYSAGNDVFLSLYRKKQQELVIGTLAALGVFCIDPLANHYVVETLKVSNGPSLPTDFAFWDGFCYRTLAACNGMVVCDNISGWETSRGVQAEIKHAGELGMHIVYATELYEMLDEEIKLLML